MLNIAVGVGYKDQENSSFVLFSSNGTQVLTYTKPAGDDAHPTAGGHPGTALLSTKTGSVLVGAMLGTDFMFMAPARALMVQGTELVLNPVAEANISSDRNAKFFAALTQDNLMTYATANYIDTDPWPTGAPAILKFNVAHSNSHVPSGFFIPQQLAAP